MRGIYIGSCVLFLLAFFFLLGKGAPVGAANCTYDFSPTTVAAGDTVTINITSAGANSTIAGGISDGQTYWSVTRVEMGTMAVAAPAPVADRHYVVWAKDQNTDTICALSSGTSELNITHLSKNAVVPIIFYASDATPPTPDQITYLNQSIGAANAYYNDNVGPIKFEPTKTLKGSKTLNDYLSTDLYGCLDQKFWCNMNAELLYYEKGQAAFGQIDTGYGWGDKIPLVFFMGAPSGRENSFASSLGLTYGTGWYFPNRGGRAIISQVTTEMAIGNYNACKNYYTAKSLTLQNIADYNLCTKNRAIGTIIHELGHAQGLLHPGSDTHPERFSVCTDGHNIMCVGGSVYAPAVWGSRYYPNSVFNSDQINMMKDDGYINPGVPTTVFATFCFAGDDPNLWCWNNPISALSTTPLAPLPPQSDIAPSVKEQFQVNWPLATFRSQICGAGNGVTSGGGNMTLTASVSGDSVTFNMSPSANSVMALLVYDSSNNVVKDSGALSEGQTSYIWNSSVPAGTYHARVFAYGTTAFSNTVTFDLGCRAFAGAGSNLYYDWSVASLRDYTAHVDISPDNGATWFGWENKDHFGVDCFGPQTCTLRLSWAAPDYHINVPQFGPVVIKTHPTSNYTFPSVPASTAYLGNTYFNDLDNFGNAHNVASYTGTTPVCVSAPNAPGGLSSSLSGSAGSQSVNLTWAQPTSWGNECGLNGTRSYRVYLGTSNPPSNAYFEPTLTNKTVSGLLPGTTVYWQVKSRNAAGLYSSLSSVAQFTTTPLSLPKPTVASGAASNIGSNSATLNGTANPNGGATSAWFRYSPLSPTSCNDTFGTKTAVTQSLSGTTGIAYSQPVADLSPGTRYYFCAIASSGGGTSLGSLESFLTLAPPPVDSDHDGFFDNVERFVGTNPNLVCGLNAWPPDINGDGAVTKLDADMFAPLIGKAVGSPGYNARYNLDMDGSISGLDVSVVSGYFFSKCTNPVKAPKGGNLDPDVDGFKTSVEFYAGTNPNLVCGLNAWPPDIDGDGQVSILDLTRIAQAFNSRIGDNKYNYRYDLNADLSISILDISSAAAYFTSKCTNPVKSQ